MPVIYKKHHFQIFSYWMRSLNLDILINIDVIPDVLLNIVHRYCSEKDRPNQGTDFRSVHIINKLNENRVYETSFLVIYPCNYKHLIREIREHLKIPKMDIKVRIIAHNTSNDKYMFNYDVLNYKNPKKEINYLYVSYKTEILIDRGKLFFNLKECCQYYLFFVGIITNNDTYISNVNFKQYYIKKNNNNIITGNSMIEGILSLFNINTNNADKYSLSKYNYNSSDKKWILNPVINKECITKDNLGTVSSENGIHSNWNSYSNNSNQFYSGYNRWSYFGDNVPGSQTHGVFVLIPL